MMDQQSRAVLQQGSGPGLLSSTTVQNRSEIFRAECRRLMLETEHSRKLLQNEHDRKKGRWTRDIQFLSVQLGLKLEEVMAETDALIVLQSRVEKARQANREPLRVTVLCLEERRNRLPPEGVHDEVDRELLQEKEVIEGAASLLQRVEEQIVEQIRLNRSAKYNLERGLKEMSEAQNSFNNMQESKLSTAATPTQQDNFSEVSITRAELQRTSSTSLRVLVDSVLEQTSTDLQKQHQATTTAFQLSTQEIRSAKTQMEEELAKIQSEYISQLRIAEDLQVAVAENDHALRLALAQSTNGPHQDPAQLSAHSNKLRQALARSEDEQRALLRCQLELQEIIDSKAAALYVNDVICGQLREPVVIHRF